jgi:hypothetical protein
VSWRYLLLLGPILFVSVVLVLERVTKNYDWTTHYISELSLREHGIFQRSNFVISGLLIVVLCLFLAFISPSPIGKAGWIAGALVGVSMISAGIWNTDVRQATRTTAGIIHEWGYWIGVAGTTLVMVLVAIANRQNRFVLTYSIIQALFSVYMIVYGGHWIKSGIYQRLLLYSMLLWIEIVGFLTLKN